MIVVSKIDDTEPQKRSEIPKMANVLGLGFTKLRLFWGVPIISTSKLMQPPRESFMAFARRQQPSRFTEICERWKFDGVNGLTWGGLSHGGSHG